MVTLTHILPSLALAPFIRYYQLLEFNTQGQELIRPWLPGPDSHLCFFLHDKPLYLQNDQTGYYIEGSHEIGILGLATQFNGLMRFRGTYRCFLVQFMPNGFFKLFGQPPDELVNKILDADNLYGQQAQDLLDKLRHACSLQDMACHADDFLRSYLNKQKDIYLMDHITQITNDLLLTKGQLATKAVARMANMSPRNFERRFKEQVGVSPKLYCRMIRFNEVIMLKMRAPAKSWQDIALEFGYHDAMHLVKEFKQFTGISPSAYLEYAPHPLVKPVFVSRTKS